MTNSKGDCSRCGMLAVKGDGSKCPALSQAHTPTPMRYKKTTMGKADVFGAPHKDGEDYARLFEVDESLASTIVRACNRDHVFEELLEALKQAELTLQNYKCDGEEAASGTLKMIRKAIAKVEGR